MDTQLLRQLLSISLIFQWSQAAQAGVFSDSFSDAAKASQAAGANAGGATRNKNGAAEAENLETAETVKTVSDVVGLGATTATIGSQIYSTVTNNDQIDKLNQQYAAAVANGNKKAAEQVLQQLDAIKAQKTTVANSQANTQQTVATIQKVAGVANLGAAAGSAYAAYAGFSAASAIKAGACNGTGLTVAEPSQNGQTTQVEKTDEQCRAGTTGQGISDLSKSKAAAKKARDAAMTSVYYAVGEAAVGGLSLALASQHQSNADSLKSLAADPGRDLSQYSEQEMALYDQVALSKCGSGYSYELLASPENAQSAATVTANGTVIRSVASTTADSTPAEYKSYFGRVKCVAPIPVANTTTPQTTVVSNPLVDAATDTQCSSDVFRCEDGSYVARDPALRCEFKACPVIAASATRSIASTSLTTTGASRMQLDDEGVVQDGEQAIRQLK